MTLITLDEIAAHHPDVLLPPDPEFAEAYARDVARGREIAARRTVAFVAICRQAMPWLPRTLALVEETGKMFADWSCFIYENDSTDGTQDVLVDAARRTNGRIAATMTTHGRPHLSHTVSQERTVALAEYREACRRWVACSTTPDYVVVFDTDPWGGWSVDGVATSIAHMDSDTSWYGLASYSWAEMTNGSTRVPIHYDAYACRWGGWQRRDQNWFHMWHPRVGGPPIEFNSAFGQLAVYDGERYLQGRYDGSDCEHVTFNRSIAEGSGGRFGLNPSSRCVSFWVPRDAGQHVHD